MSYYFEDDNENFFIFVEFEWMDLMGSAIDLVFLKGSLCWYGELIGGYMNEMNRVKSLS